MARYLIEVEHEAEPMACLHAVRILMTTGSHFLTHADYGCLDGVHKCWLIIDVESKDEALSVVPPAFRSRATVVKLNRFSLENVHEMMHSHEHQLDSEEQRS